jgi:serine/threonine protein kinase
MSENKKNPDRLSLRLDSLNSQDVIRLGIAVCDALESVGKDGYHGGIRPDSIYIGPGNAVSLGPVSHRKANELGPDELEYVSPELFWSGEMAPAGDVYSLGLILYAGLNGGRLPFLPTTGEIWASDRAEALQRRMKGEEIPPLEGVDAELAQVLLRALAFHPEERWLDPAEFRAALSDCSLGIAATLPVPPDSQAAFGKPPSELSTVELMMAEIIGIDPNKPQQDQGSAAGEQKTPESPGKKSPPESGSPNRQKTSPSKTEPAPPEKEAATPKKEAPSAALTPKADSNAKTAAFAKPPEKAVKRRSLILAAATAIVVVAVALLIILNPWGKDEIIEPSPSPAATEELPPADEASVISPGPSAPAVPSPAPEPASSPALEPTPSPTPAPDFSASAIRASSSSWDLMMGRVPPISRHF